MNLNGNFYVLFYKDTTLAACPILAIYFYSFIKILDILAKTKKNYPIFLEFLHLFSLNLKD